MFDSATATAVAAAFEALADCCFFALAAFGDGSGEDSEYDDVDSAAFSDGDCVTTDDSVPE